MLARMQEELEYLYNLERFGIQPGLAVMEQLMDALGRPQHAFKSIHVTGTNGKGSTCAMLESVLRAAGLKTALYTSPHLYVFNERIQVGGSSISDGDLIRLIQEIHEIIDQEHIQPTFFEFTTALAFLYFARSNIDIAVIEVGMGGLLDATNVITPIVSIITNVGLDHMEFLGNTTDEIAREKAGIIKEGIPVVVREEDGNVLRIFDERAVQKNTHVIRAQDTARTQVLHVDFAGQDIEVCVRNREGYKIHLPLLGAHQVKNLEAVVVACEELVSVGIVISERDVMHGITSTIWEGRLQIASQKPLIIVDGAHNPDGARVLVDFLESIPMCDVLVFAAKKGKNIAEVLNILLPRCKRVIVTKGSYMPEDPESIAKMIRSMQREVEIRDTVADAIALGLSYVDDEGIMLIAGSLYMIPDALALLKQSEV